MKKSIFFLMAAVGLFTACDPSQSEKDFDPVSLSAGDVEGAITITQTDADGNPAADGNYFTYTTNPATMVSVYNYLSDGSENQLARGFSGSFAIKPKRGSDPNQTFYVRTVNSDNSEVLLTKTYTVFVQQELDPELRLLASDSYGSKTWKWDPSISGAVWGNMGYCGGAGSDVGISGNGQWWGIDSSEEFNNQLQHSEGGVNHGDGDLDAYMVFNDEGIVTSYAADGSVIRTGSYVVENYDPNGEWKVGDLRTDAILWPWVINTNATLPSACGWGTGAYEIVYLTADKMTLVYPGSEASEKGLGSWSEATFWHFKSDSDIEGMAVGYGKEAKKSWTWDSSITGTVWGNRGYCGGSGSDVGTTGNGQWWGVTSTDEFNGQLQHSAGGVNHGDGDLDAYMTFDAEGILTSYAADGSVIRSGSFEFAPITGNDWKVAELKTDAILWPWIINTGATTPSEATWGPGAYEVVYLTSDKMTLVYPGHDDDGNANGLGNWGEATYWHFKAK